MRSIIAVSFAALVAVLASGSFPAPTWGQSCMAVNQSCGTKPCCGEIDGSGTARCVNKTCERATPGATSPPTTTPTTVPPGTVPPDTVPPSTTPGTTNPPTTTPPPSAFAFPTGRDLRVGLRRNQRCKYVAGRTATQPERAAMYLLGVARLMPEGLLYAKYHSNCAPVAFGKSAGDLELENSRLRVFYIDPLRNAVWNIVSDNGCPEYQHVEDEGKRLRACSTANEKARQDCAASPHMTPDLLAWLGMRKDGGRCVRDDSAGSWPTIPAQEDKAVRLVGMLDYRVPIMATPAFRRVVAAVLAVHHAADHAYCAGAAGPPAGAVQAAAARCFTDPGLSPEERHACLLVFTAARDEAPGFGWTRQESCDWKMLEGVALDEWGGRCLDDPPPVNPGDPVELRRWPCLTRTRITHETLHVCAAFKTDKAVRIGNHDNEQLTDRKMETCEHFLRCQTGELPGCRRDWVPDPAAWRMEAM